MTRSLGSSTVRERPVTFGVMARAPVQGRCKTRLAKTLGFEGAARLYRAMLLDRLDAVSALPTARRVVVAAPEDDGLATLRAMAPPSWEILEQRGADLGERLANATRDLLASAEPATRGLVCLVDSDSPTLPMAQLFPKLSATRSSSSIILGACTDGGYYLIGLDAPHIGVYEGVPWSTETVAEATRARCAALGLDVVELETWYDVDDGDDLARLERDLHETPSLAPRTAAFFREGR
jgi:rSAM/selenodomain-associated transferase 1